MSLPAPVPGAPALRCVDVEAGYSSSAVLRGLNLELDAGQVMAVLGPSGAGKTTLLHTVAGFIQPRGGEIWIGGEQVDGGGRQVPPERRNVGVVFQDHALWPHLSVAETVAYPLRRQGVSRANARQQSIQLLDRLGLGEFVDRRPRHLSGGQRQRVGLARALARGAGLYLFDEPTVHLDLPLREIVKGVIDTGRNLTRSAAVYTTHDAGDALAIADRVAILLDGTLAQVGTPGEVYERPLSVAIAQLSGTASVLDPAIDERNSEVVIDGERVPVASAGVPPRKGGLRLVVRPGWAALGGPLGGTVSQVLFRGPHTDHVLRTSSGEVVVRQPGAPAAGPGDEVNWTLRRGWLAEA